MRIKTIGYKTTTDGAALRYTRPSLIVVGQYPIRDVPGVRRSNELAIHRELYGDYLGSCCLWEQRDRWWLFPHNDDGTPYHVGCEHLTADYIMAIFDVDSGPYDNVSFEYEPDRVFAHGYTPTKKGRKEGIAVIMAVGEEVTVVRSDTPPSLLERWFPNLYSQRTIQTPERLTVRWDGRQLRFIES
jgi:hypothetical protein